MPNNVVNKTVNIFIESGQAQKALDALIKKETALKNELAAATNPKVVERLNKEIAALAEPIDRASKKLSGELSPSFRDVAATVNNLGNRLKKLSSEDADFEHTLAQWRQGKVELDAQTQKVGVLQRAMNSFWKEAKTVAVGVIVGSTVQSALETVGGYVTGMITGSAKIADELSNIEKTTGLTKEQVRQLNSELSKIDTRTGTGQLREIASGLGQIGQAATATNVAAIDKIVVALGDEFGGGAKEITTTLGVLRNNLQDIKTGNYGDDVLHIGNALNVLGAEGLATAPVVTDIANRIAGVGQTFGLSSGQILGTAATFQELGIEAERGSTAFIKILQRMAAEPEKFAAVTGKSVADFKKLVNEDIEGAFVAVAKGAREAGADNATFGKILKDLDADGSGAGEVLSKLATNAELLQSKIKLSTGALKESNSITSEFNTLNNNAAGELEKLKKNFASLFSSSTVTEGSAAVVRTLNSLVKTLKAAPAFIQENRSAFALLLTGLVLLNREYIVSALATAKATAAKARDLIATKLSEAATTAQILKEELASIAIQRKTGVITAAAAAQQRANLIVSAAGGPLGALLLVVGLLVIAYNAFANSSQKLNAEQRIQAELSEKIAESTTDTVTRIQNLVAVIEDEKTSLEGKKKAYNDLIALNPEFAKTLTIDAQGHLQGKSAIDAYIASLNKKALAEAQYSLLVDKQKERITAQNDLDKKDKALPTSTLGQVGSAVLDIVGVGAYANYDEAKQKVKDLDDDIDVLKKKTEATARDTYNDGNAGTKKLSTTKTYTSPSDTKKTDKGENKLERNRKKAADEYRKLADDLQKIALDILPDDTLTAKLDKQIQEFEKKFADEREKINSAEGLSTEKKNVLLLQLDDVYAKAKTQLYKDQAAEIKTVLDKEAADNKKRGDEMQANLRKLTPLSLKLEGSALQLNDTLGRGEAAKKELADRKRSAKEKYDFLLQQLRDEKAAVLANTQLLGVEKENLVQQIDEKIAAEQKKHLVGQLQGALDYAKQALDLVNLFGAAKTDKENAELARDKAANDKKKRNLDDRLKKGLLSQADHDRQVAAIDKKAEAREKEIKTKQFKRNQKAQITQAIMNGALAVTNILATMPKFDFGVASAIAIAASIATTAVQVANISAQKTPEYGTGGLLNGPSHRHKSKGMPVTNPLTGQVQAYLEGGEGIGSKRTMDDARQYNVSGTPSQIFSLLNGINGGVSWQSGAVLKPTWQTAVPVPMNFGAVNESIGTVRRYYATGGSFGDAAPAGGDASVADTNGPAMINVMQQLLATSQALNTTLASLQAYGITANVSLGSLEDAQKRKQAIVDAGTMR